MRRILLIEDDTDQALGLLRRFEAEHWACDRAETFAAGLEKAKQTRFDCAVVDVGLPDLDIESGKDSADRLNELGCQVVVYTGSGNFNLVKKVRDTGARYVQKPGEKLCIEAIYTQLTYKTDDQESQMGLVRTQRSIASGQNKGFWAAMRENTLFSIALLGGAFSTGMWAFHTVSGEVQERDATLHHFELLDKELADLQADRAKRIEYAESWRSSRDDQIHALQLHDQATIDDRVSLHQEVSHIETDLVRRLERIEEKLDRNTQLHP